MIIKKRISQLNRSELSSIIAIVIPGRKADYFSTQQMQEICIKWIFANALSINHIFEFQEENGEIFCIMRNSQACSCCVKDSETASIAEFERGPIADTFRRSRTPSPVRPPVRENVPKFTVGPQAKVTPVDVPPTIITIEPKGDDEWKNGKRKKVEQEKTTWENCKRDCGYCFVNLCQQC